MSGVKGLLQTLAERVQPWLAYVSSGWRRKAISGFFVLLTLAVIAQVIYQNRETLLNHNWQIQPIWFIGIIGFFLVDLLVALFVWHLMLKRLAGYNNFRRATKIVLYANLARRLPGSGWYIASRAVLYAEEGISKKSSSLLSGLELTFFMCSGAIVSLLSLPFWAVPEDGNRLSVLLLVLPLTALFVHPRVLGWLWQRSAPQQSIHALRWQDTLSWLLLHMVTWVLGGGFLFAVINLIWPLAWSAFPLAVGAWALAGTVSLVGFISFSFFGLREITLGLLLTSAVPPPVALIVAILVRLLWLAGELITALISFLL